MKVLALVAPPTPAVAWLVRAAEAQRTRAVPLVDVFSTRSQLALQARQRGVTIDY